MVNAAWKELAARGFITGDGAAELKQISPLVFDKNDEELQCPEKGFCMLSIGLYMCAAFTIGADELAEKDCIKVFGMNQEAKLEAHMY